MGGCSRWSRLQKEMQSRPEWNSLLAAIQGSREALEGQIAGVSIEVNLLYADVCKVADKIDTWSLRLLPCKLRCGNWNNRYPRSQGAQGQNNIRLLRFPERIERQSAETLLEDWV
ncbi:hypothetical protein NDU88_005213 [Pleurodeles waltl]|uniref:Uncharacterized protein n=1 Tax=Pleurodeles waltl TaxID=8319 RepID=A0AAV7X012_PLEWA|nr:hypothetical protein NDU88_005213 [Pleurodeles waltl]